MHCINVVLLPPTETTNEEFVSLPQGWKMLLKSDEKFNNAIYVSTDYFGGGGEQYATVIKEGVELPNETWNTDKYRPINDALRYFGLKKDKNSDEFDTIHLGRYRSNEDVSQLLPSNPLNVEYPFDED